MAISTVARITKKYSKSLLQVKTISEIFRMVELLLISRFGHCCFKAKTSFFNFYDDIFLQCTKDPFSLTRQNLGKKISFYLQSVKLHSIGSHKIANTIIQIQRIFRSPYDLSQPIKNDMFLF